MGLALAFWMFVAMCLVIYIVWTRAEQGTKNERRKIPPNKAWQSRAYLRKKPENRGKRSRVRPAARKEKK